MSKSRIELLRSRKRVTPELHKLIKKLGKESRQNLEKILRVSTTTNIKIPRFLNPTLYFYVGDRLFFLYKDLIVNKPIFNNNFTKKPSGARINKKAKLLELFWTDRESKEGLGNPFMFCQMLEKSNDRFMYQIS